MNAPQSAAALEKPSLQLVPVSALVPSKSHVQERRRARFVAKDTQELAEDIKRLGMMHQPIVRFVPGMPAGKYDIVTGEQRWLAAKILGWKEIYVNVRELSDDVALEMQLSENLRRKDLHQLEEAEGYDELMQLKKISAEAIAEIVGRSESYVHKRMKLLSLGPDARKAFYAGEMDASTALLIARIQGPDFQTRAMADLKRERDCGGCVTVKETSDFIRDRFMLRLKAAPFDTKDEQLLPAAGSCQKCPKRSGNQVDLFEAKDTDICTDLKCFDEKRQAHFAIARKNLEAEGKKVIHGDAAKKAMPGWQHGGGELAGGYVGLKDWSHELGAKVGDALPKDHEPTLIQHPASGQIIEVATTQAVTKARLLQNKGKRSGSAGASRYSVAKPAKPKGPDVDQQLTERLVKLIREKAPKEFGKLHLTGLAQRLLHISNARSEDLAHSAKARGWPAGALKSNHYDEKKLPAQAAKCDVRDLTLLMLEIAFHSDRYHRKPILELFGISEEKTRELIIEERKAARSKKTKK